MFANAWRCSDQRPKNNHNRIITGIGTPSSQSRIPLPMFASLDLLSWRENVREMEGFLPA
jgi:hypothetical protein